MRINTTEVVKVGDFNCAVETFLENEGLVQLSDLFYNYSFKLCDCLYDDDINYAFRCITHNAFSWMDYFFS